MSEALETVLPGMETTNILDSHPDAWKARYLNAYGDVNLKIVRKQLSPYDLRFLDKTSGLFCQWVKEDLELYLKRTDEKTQKEDYLAVKARKRGNDIDDFLITRRMKAMKDAILPYTFDPDGEPYEMLMSKDLPHLSTSQTRVLYITQTIDPRLVDGDFNYAWKYLGHWFNKFKAKLAKRLGCHLKVLRSWESSLKGWPHIHAIICFDGFTWTTTEHLSTQGKNKGKTTWRLKARWATDVFKDCWPEGWIDILAVTPGTVEKSITNILWYITKSLSDMDYRMVETWPKKRLLTQSLMWFYGLRSFAVSKSFLEGVDSEPGRLDNAECVTKTGIEDFLHELNPENAYSYEILGVVKRRDTEIKREDWITPYSEPPPWVEWTWKPESILYAEQAEVRKEIELLQVLVKKYVQLPLNEDWWD